MESENIFNKPTTYSCSANEMILLFGTALLLIILLSEFFDITGLFLFPMLTKPKTKPKPLPSVPISFPSNSTIMEKFEYGYQDYNGPAMWKCNFPDATGNRQSPINITCSNAIVCPIQPLHWSCEYTFVPNKIKMINDGHCVTLQVRFSGMRPSICGGPLKGNYDLYVIRFRWGPTDDEGSEHTIDYKRFAMEMQAVHVKSDNLTAKSSRSSRSIPKEIVVVLSYVFHVTTIDNPYLDPLIAKLDHIKYPGCSTTISSFPMCWLMPTFVSDYYMYSGSLTHPPCTEGVQWIVQPEPLAISPRQVRKFRKLVTRQDGKMLSNTRPIQCLNNREVFYYTSDCNCK